MLFVERLFQPLCGWVKGYQPTTLRDAVGKTRDMQDVVPRSKFPTKPSFPQRNKEAKPIQKEYTEKSQPNHPSLKGTRSLNLLPTTCG